MEIYLKDDVSEKTEIWRYMDLTKFLDLILNKKIYMRRIDKFDDPYEGFISNTYENDLLKTYKAFESFNVLSSEKLNNIFYIT